MYKKTLAFMSLFLFFSNYFAQEALELSGFYQAQYFYISKDKAYPSEPTRYNANLQQLNLLLARSFSDNVFAFVNLELINNFNFQRTWGNFSIQEAFIRMNFYDLLNLKAGIFYPRFAAFNEIKNRFPLIPYIYRPVIYESSMQQIFDFADFVPETGALQIYGSYFVEKFSFEYALFAGNAEKTFFNSAAIPLFTKLQGVDTSDFKVFGGRIGAKAKLGNLGIYEGGFSYAVDKDKETNKLLGFAPSPVRRYFGVLSRNRYAFDFSANLFNFYLAAEHITVKYKPDQKQKNTLQQAKQLIESSGKKGSVGFDKRFYYVTLGYTIFDKIMLYGSYSYMEDKLIYLLTEGFELGSGGLSYMYNDNVTFKFQYSYIYNKSKTFNSEKDILYPFLVGISVYF